MSSRDGTVSPARLSGLDLLRACAVTLVLLLHAQLCVTGMPDSWRFVMERGWAGVDLFFVLSGFLIGGQVFRERTATRPLADFWARRWFRTIPLYLAVLFAYAVLKPLAGFAFQGGWSWRFLAFAQNYAPLSDFVQSWSLCVEEQFYLVFPVLAFVLGFRKLPAVAWLVPMMASFAFRLADLGWSAWVYGGAGSAQAPAGRNLDFLVRFPTHTHLDGISFGVFLAASAPVWLKWPRALRHALGAVGLALAAAALAFDRFPGYSGAASPFTYLVLALGFGGMLVSAVDLELPRAAVPFVEKVALWSYGAYLWNNLVMRILDRARPDWPWWMGAAVFVGSSFALAALTYYALEKPFLRLRAKVLARLKDQEPSPNTLPKSSAA